MYKYLIFVAESPYIYTGTRIQDWDDRESNIERGVIKSLFENLGAESEYMNIICRKHSKYWLKREYADKV